MMQVPAAAHRPASGSRLGVSHSRLLRPRSTALLCRAALTTPRPLACSTARRPAPFGGLLLPAAAHPQSRQQQPQPRGSSTLVRSKKDKSYMFEVEWTGEDRQVQSGQAEQTMINRYLSLLRESDLLNQLRARRQFERPRDRQQRRFAERVERRKWERQQDGFVPESLASAGGSQQHVEEPFLDMFGLRAEWDTVTDAGELAAAQAAAQAEEVGRYTYNDKGFIELDAYMQEDVSGGYISPAAAAAAVAGGVAPLQQQGGYAAAAASGGGYVQQDAASLSGVMVDLEALTNFAQTVPTDVGFWESMLAAEQQQVQQQYSQGQQLVEPAQGFGGLQGADATAQQQLQAGIDYTGAAAAGPPGVTGLGLPSLPLPPAAPAAPAAPQQQPWSAAAAGYGLAAVNPTEPNSVPPPPQQQQQQQQQSGPQAFQEPAWLSQQQQQQQQQQQDALAGAGMGLPPLPVDLAAFGWPDLSFAAATAPGFSEQPGQQAKQEQQFFQKQEEQQEQQRLAEEQPLEPQQPLVQADMQQQEAEQPPQQLLLQQEEEDEVQDTQPVLSEQPTAELSPAAVPEPTEAAAAVPQPTEAAAAAAAEDSVPAVVPAAEETPAGLPVEITAADAEATAAAAAAAAEQAVSPSSAMSDLADAALLAEAAAAAAAVDVAAAEPSPPAPPAPAAAVAPEAAAAAVAPEAAAPAAKSRRRSRKPTAAATAADTPDPAAAPAAVAPSTKKPAAKRTAARPSTDAVSGSTSGGSTSDFLKETQAVLAASRDSAKALDDLLRSNGMLPNLPANGTANGTANGAPANGTANGTANGAPANGAANGVAAGSQKTASRAANGVPAGKAAGKIGSSGSKAAAGGSRGRRSGSSSQEPQSQKKGSAVAAC